MSTSLLLARHLGYAPTAELVQIDPASRIIRRASLGDVARLLSPADLARCLSEHPRQAVELVYRYLDLHWVSLAAALDHDGAAEFARLVDHATPHEPSDVISAHDVPLAGCGMRSLHHGAGGGQC